MGGSASGGVKRGNAAIRADQSRIFRQRPKSIAEISAKTKSQRQTRSAMVGGLGDLKQARTDVRDREAEMPCDRHFYEKMLGRCFRLLGAEVV
jgi:hypothetical protein